MKYNIQAGDTLYSISKKFNTTTAELLSLNGWTSPPPLQIGQEITVKNNAEKPQVTNSDTYTVVQGDSLYAIGRQFNISPSAILSFNNLDQNAGLFIGQILKIPSAEKANTQKEKSPTNTSKHIVSQGESLYAISKKYKTTPQELLSYNQLDNISPLYIGQELKIPSPTVKETTTTISPSPSIQQKRIYTVIQGDTLYQISRKVGLSPQQILELNGLDGSTPIFIGQELKVQKNQDSITPTVHKPTTKPIVKTSQRTHTVQRGESLYAISKKYKCTPAGILAVNGMALDATIYIGQSLKIPTENKQKDLSSSTPQNTSGTSIKRNIYTVKSGDYISKIAKQFNITPQALVAHNHLPQGRIYVGQELKIPTNLSSSESNSSLQGSRGIYQLSKVDGKQKINIKLQSTISPNSRISQNDLQGIQARLVELGVLSSLHSENAQHLSRSNGGQIPGSKIPKTLSAIKSLQNKYRLNWWVESPKRTEMLGTNSFTYGEIHTNDITHKFLREFTNYTLTFPHPLTGQSETAEFKNFVRSGYNQYYDGVGYVGKSLPSSIPLHVYTEVGLSKTLAQAMQVVSSHEGNFDAINSYDKAFFSYGFIQFAGGGRGLAPVIARMKVSQPNLFKKIFQSAGIDVTYTTRNNDIHQGELIINFPGKGTLKGEAAEKELRGNHQMYGPFIRAAFHPDLIKAQIEQAVKAYAKPALGIKLNIQTNGFSSSNVPLTDFINSAMGLGFAIDMTVNKWIVKTGQMFSDAINTIARKRGLISFEQLALIDEKEVIQEIVNKEGPADKRVADRGNSMMHSGLSFAKNPSKGAGLIA